MHLVLYLIFLKSSVFKKNNSGKKWINVLIVKLKVAARPDITQAQFHIVYT